MLSDVEKLFFWFFAADLEEEKKFIKAITRFEYFEGCPSTRWMIHEAIKFASEERNDLSSTMLINFN